MCSTTPPRTEIFESSSSKRPFLISTVPSILTLVPGGVFRLEIKNKQKVINTKCCFIQQFSRQQKWIYFKIVFLDGIWAAVLRIRTQNESGKKIIIIIIIYYNITKAKWVCFPPVLNLTFLIRTSSPLVFMAAHGSFNLPLAVLRRLGEFELICQKSCSSRQLTSSNHTKALLDGNQRCTMCASNRTDVVMLFNSGLEIMRE